MTLLPCPTPKPMNNGCELPACPPPPRALHNCKHVDAQALPVLPQLSLRDSSERDVISSKDSDAFFLPIPEDVAENPSADNLPDEPSLPSGLTLPNSSTLARLKPRPRKYTGPNCTDPCRTSGKDASSSYSSIGSPSAFQSIYHAGGNVPQPKLCKSPSVSHKYRAKKELVIG